MSDFPPTVNNRRAALHLNQHRNTIAKHQAEGLLSTPVRREELETILGRKLTGRDHDAATITLNRQSMEAA